MILELETKNFNIEDLKSPIEEQQQENEASTARLEEKICIEGLKYAGEIASKDRIIDELEDWLQRRQQDLWKKKFRNGGRGRRRRHDIKNKLETQTTKEQDGQEKFGLRSASGDDQTSAKLIKMEE